MAAYNDVVLSFGRFLQNMQIGLQGITTQSYSEVNSKFGVQHEMSLYAPSVTASGAYNIIFATGSVPVSIKGMSLAFDGSLVSTQWFKAPTFSGGTNIPVFNMRDDRAVSPQVVLTGGAVVTDDGTAVSSRSFALGSSGVGNQLISSLGLDEGVERILGENSIYLYKIINASGVAAASITGSGTWYEGALDY